MKIAVGSDLHLEFGELKLDTPAEDVKTLVLPGDIIVAQALKNEIQMVTRDISIEFFREVSELYDDVIYVFGNHEFYNSEYTVAKELIMDILPDNVHVLDNSSIIIKGQKFVGSTMWTDMGQLDSYDLNRIRQAMNDYHCTKIGYERMNPYHTKKFFETAYQYLFGNMDKDTVVVTHHLPSWRSVHSKYANDPLMSHAYASHLDEEIRHCQPKLWLHGHSHEPHDYDIGNTRILSNPRGYIGHEPQADGYKFKVITI